MGKQLKPEQYIAIQYLAMPKYGGKTLQQIADECGVHRNTLLKWRKDRYFEEEWKREMKRKSQERLPEVIEAMADFAIREGNAAMCKLLLQLNGLLTDKVEVSHTQKADDYEIDYDELDREIEEFEKRLQ
jgi:transcriptional regulator with XRE-family HTH domain